MSKKQFLGYFFLSLLTFFSLGGLIAIIWKEAGIPQAGFYSAFFIFGLPLVYLIFLVIYSFLYFFNPSQKLYSALKLDAYTYLFSLIFLVLEIAWPGIGNWRLCFTCFLIFLVLVKLILLSKFLFGERFKNYFNLKDRWLKTNQDYLFLIFLSLIVSFIFGKLIWLFWERFGVPQIPPIEKWGIIPKAYVWRHYFSLWLPLLYISFSLVYSVFFFFSQKRLFLKNNWLKKDFLFGVEEKKKVIFEKAISNDTLTYLFLPLFLLMEVAWKQLGGWFLWFGIFYLFLISLKGFILIRFIFHSYIREGEVALSLFNYRKIKGELFLATFIIYFLLAGWQNVSISTTGDEPYYLLITHTLVKDKDWDLKNNFQNKDYLPFYWGGSLWAGQNMIETEEGGLLSTAYNGLYPMLLFPGYLWRGRLGAMVCNGVFASFLMLNVFLLCWEITQSFPASFYTWLVMAFTAPIFFFSSQLYPEIIAGLIVIFVYRKIRNLPENLLTNLSLVALGLLILPGLKMRYASLSVGLLLLAILRLKKVKFIGTLPPHQNFWCEDKGCEKDKFHRKAPPPHQCIGGGGPPFIAGCGGLLLFGIISAALIIFLDRFLFQGTLFWSRYGNIQMVINKLKWHNYIISGALGLFFDQEFGLLFYSPFYLIIFFSLPFAFRDNKKDFFMIMFPCLIYTYIVLNHFSRKWYGGWSLPSRYVICLLPLLGVFMAKGFQIWRGKIFCWLSGIFALWSFLVVFLLSLKPFWRYNQVDGSTNLLEILGRSLSINLTRFLPSFVNYSPFRFKLAILILLVTFTVGICFCWQRKNKNTLILNEAGMDFREIIFVPILTVSFILGGMFTVWAGNNIVTSYLEAEAMQHTGGVIYTGYPDGNVWVMKESGRSYDYFVSRGGRVTFKIYTGGQTSGSIMPHIVLKVDNKTIGEADTLADERWERGVCSFTTELEPGKHWLSIEFTNGIFSPETGEIRSLYLDKIIIEKAKAKFSKHWLSQRV